MNNWAEENTAEALKAYENRVQLTIISISTKGEKQAGTIQLTKYIIYICCSLAIWKQMGKIKQKNRRSLELFSLAGRVLKAKEH